MSVFSPPLQLSAVFLAEDSNGHLNTPPDDTVHQTIRLLWISFATTRNRQLKCLEDKTPASILLDEII